MMERNDKIQLFEDKRIRTAKLWLAEVGRERIGETIDPELTIERAAQSPNKMTTQTRIRKIDAATTA